MLSKCYTFSKKSFWCRINDFHNFSRGENFQRESSKRAFIFVKCIITRPENIGSFPLIGFISLLFIYNVSVTHMWQRLKVVSMTNTEEFLSRQQNFSISYFAFQYSQICYKWCSSYGHNSYKSLRISLRLKKFCEVVNVCIDSAGFLSSLFIMPFWLRICFIFLVSLKIDTDGWRPPDSSNRIL